MRLLAIFLALTVWAAPVLARDLSSAENASLTETVAAFDAAMRSGNYDRVADTIPPRVMKQIAETAGMDEAKLRPLIVEQMKAALAAVKINNFSMDLAAAEHKQTASGQPYVLIPTVTDMTASGSTMVVKSHTLALLDEGKWYLLRVQDPGQLQILQKVYPEFAGVEFPAGSMEAK